jgi:alpha-L-fucosidase
MPPIQSTGYPIILTLLACLVQPLAAQVIYPSETHATPIPAIKDIPEITGPFQASYDSLKQFKCPDWFRDGKLGIWSHWGPQSTPGVDDWYAYHMYLPKLDCYKTHVATYGHPSKFGYKDILPLWKAEKWEPERLMKLYKEAGAHYFVAQAVHHDNFDNWNSKYHKWNSVNIGPHQDVMAVWHEAARKEGLPFGVSEHLGHSFSYMQPSHGSDTNGLLKGVPYDGANPALWDLYQLPATQKDADWWYTSDPRWPQEWYARIHDLIEQQQPDLLYTDGGIPFHEIGRSIVAQLYNESVQNHDGKLNAVYCCKKNYSPSGEFVEGTCVQDVERGGMKDIQPYPWQTDTSAGAWYFSKNDHYKTSTEILQTLIDIVSKNGNLLLNITQYADGSLPPEMETLLTEMADWMKVNGEAVFGTRPWLIYGEGPNHMKEGSFNEKNMKYSAQDIRFTRKGTDLYVTTLGIPTKSVVIKSLSKQSPLVTSDPKEITLLGFPKQLTWRRNNSGMTIDIPKDLTNKSTLSFKITGLQTNEAIDPATLAAFKSYLLLHQE